MHVFIFLDGIFGVVQSAAVSANGQSRRTLPLPYPDGVVDGLLEEHLGRNPAHGLPARRGDFTHCAGGAGRVGLLEHLHQRRRQGLAVGLPIVTSKPA
eukprot:scaffold545_cov38-Prasinocladus_malaysianus.AAC.3